MCIFLSWLHYEGEDLFISDDTLKTFEGKALKKHLDTYFWDDIVGHGALMNLHKMKGYSGDHIEVAHFFGPSDFPRPIFEAIDQCKFRTIGMPQTITQLLKTKIAIEFEKIQTKKHLIYKQARDKINLFYSKAIEKLRQEDRTRDKEYSKECDRVIFEAFEIRNKKANELEAKHNNVPKNICPERRAFFLKKEKIMDAYRRVEKSALNKRDELRRKSNPNKEIDGLFKKNRIEANEIFDIYRSEKVAMFWDLFEDINNRKKVWKEMP